MTESTSLIHTGQSNYNSPRSQQGEFNYDSAKNDYLGRYEADNMSVSSDDSQVRNLPETTAHKVGRWTLQILGGLLFAAGIAAITAGIILSGGAAVAGVATFFATSAAAIGLVCTSLAMEPNTSMLEADRQEPESLRAPIDTNRYLLGSAPEKINKQKEIPLNKKKEEKLTDNQKKFLKELNEYIDRYIKFEPVATYNSYKESGGMKLTAEDKANFEAEKERYKQMSREEIDKLRRKQAKIDRNRDVIQFIPKTNPFDD
ncbi:MAG: hypothetical protein K6F05_02010 [Succinivibrio sp.]|nr:hypothetical protein [Succinivibrio sp.]